MRTRCSRSRPTWTPRVIASSTSTLLLRIQATGKSSSLNMTRTSLVSCRRRLCWRIELKQHLKTGLEPPLSSSAVFATCTYSSFLFVCFLHDVKNVLKMYRLSSGEELRTFPLDVGSVVGFTGRKRDSEIFYYFTSFLSPGTSCVRSRFKFM